MKTVKCGHNHAIILLHEIYGINQYSEEMAAAYRKMGFEVFCPDLLQRQCFSYTESETAYQYFINEVGFDKYKEIEDLIIELKTSYDKVFLLGFSVGATIAWRCSENSRCDGVICCYGSRIRDYLSLIPACSVLLIFAEHDTFNLVEVIEALQEKPNTTILVAKANHGFLDPYGLSFDEEQAQVMKAQIKGFLINNNTVPIFRRKRYGRDDCR